MTKIFCEVKNEKNGIIMNEEKLLVPSDDGLSFLAKGNKRDVVKECDDFAATTQAISPRVECRWELTTGHQP